MIIDSHAHYAHAKFDTEFPYLYTKDAEYAIERASRNELLKIMRESGIVGVIEPSIGFDDIDGQLALVSEHSSYMWCALGVHPTRCIYTPWKNRLQVANLAGRGDIIAIGETGLDYHHPRKKQFRLRQKRWFNYLIKLSDELKLPLVLHIRQADKDALKILTRHRSSLHGGVVHCFAGNYELARKYIALGFHIGIGGKLLCDNEEGRALTDAVKNAPLSSLLIETDAPFVLPDIGELSSSKHQAKRLCNSSFILPKVIERIAEIRGEDAKAIEDAIFENTVRAFNLNVMFSN